MAQTVADVLIGALEQIGVKHVFGLIGGCWGKSGHRAELSPWPLMTDFVAEVSGFKPSAPVQSFLKRPLIVPLARPRGAISANTITQDTHRLLAAVWQLTLLGGEGSARWRRA